MAIRTFYVFAFIFHMVCVTFATFATYLASSLYFFAMSKFLYLKNRKGASIYFYIPSIVSPILISFGIYGFSKVRMYVWVCMV